MTMEYIILKSEAKKKLKLLAQLARELGVNVQFASLEEIEAMEDEGIGQAIDKGLKSPKVEEEDILKALGR